MYFHFPKNSRCQRRVVRLALISAIVQLPEQVGDIQLWSNLNCLGITESVGSADFLIFIEYDRPLVANLLSKTCAHHAAAIYLMADDCVLIPCRGCQNITFNMLNAHTNSLMFKISNFSDANPSNSL